MKYYNYPDPRGTEVAEDVDSRNISDFAPGGSVGLIDLSSISVSSVTVDGHTFTPGTDTLYATEKEGAEASAVDAAIFIVESNIDFSKNIYTASEEMGTSIVTSWGSFTFATPEIHPDFGEGFYIEGPANAIFGGDTLIVKPSSIKYGKVVPTMG